MSILTKPIQDVTVDDIQKLIDAKVRESYYVEYKAQWPSQAIAVWLCAFANYEGGLILIGVDADGNGFPTAICGVPNDQAKPDSVDLEAYRVTPPIFGLWESRAIPLTTDPSRSVLVIRVKSGAADIPYNVDGVSYIRTDGSKRKLIDPQSPRVGVASATEMISLLRKRARAIEIRDALIDEARSRLERIGTKTEFEFGKMTTVFEMIIIPEHIYNPKGTISLTEFARIAATKALIFPAKRFPFWHETNNLLKLREGIAEYSESNARQRYIDVSRSGLIAFRDGGQFDAKGMVFIDRALSLILHLGVYAARLYRTIEKAGNLLVQVKLFNVRGKSQYSTDSFNDHRPIAEDFLFSTASISSFDLANNPLTALSELIDEFIFPANLAAAETMEKLAKSLAIRNIYQDGGWVKDWIENESR